MHTTTPGHPHRTPVDTSAAGHPASAQTTKAALQRAYGSPSQIRVARTDLAPLAEGEVLVEVHAAGLDRGAWHLATGRPFVMRLIGFGLRRPRQPIVGTEVAGVVTQVGPGVTALALGDEVYGTARGSFAEQAIASVHTLAKKPASVSFAEASAAGVSGVTAQAACERAQITAGQRVLVLGAAGGVGSLVTQLVESAGARVTGVASASKLAFVAQLGAHETVDYGTTDITASGRQWDVIIDCGGLTPLRKLRRVLTRNGTLVIVGGEGGGPFAGGAGRQLWASLVSLFTRQTLTGLMASTHTADLQRLAARLEAGQARPAVTATYPLADAAAAMIELESGRVAGKAVIAVR